MNLDEPVDRRVWIATALASVSLAGFKSAPADDEVGSADPEHALVDPVLTRARAVGLSGFQQIRTAHYVAIGNATEPFLKLCLRDCEAVAADYLEHYRGKGFSVEMPESRMVVVVLHDDRDFFRYLGIKPSGILGGIYDRSNNRLHVYDSRQTGPLGRLRPGHANLMNLAHEGTHQLTFNTGLLDREHLAPLCVVEGLAMYGEVRSFDRRSPPGRVHSVRLEDLANLQRQGVEWIPLPTLLADDTYLRGEHGEGKLLVGYAQSWLFVHYLMSQSAMVPRFRAYLAAARGRDTKASRVEDATTHLGDLQALDQRLRRYSVALLKRTF